MKLAKMKAVAAIELVGAGAALAGGSIMMEKMVETPSSPQVTGHDNVYGADSSPSIIKFESLASEHDNMSTIEVVGWIIFALILVMPTVL